MEFINYTINIIMHSEWESNSWRYQCSTKSAAVAVSNKKLNFCVITAVIVFHLSFLSCAVVSLPLPENLVT